MKITQLRNFRVDSSADLERPETERERERERDRQTDRQSDKQTNKQTDTDTDIGKLWERKAEDVIIESVGVHKDVGLQHFQVLEIVKKRRKEKKGRP